MLERLLRSLTSHWPQRARAASPSPVERAMSRYRVADYAEAERLLAAMLRERPADTDVLTKLAMVHLAQNARADAAVLLEKAIRLDPQFAPAHCHYAILHRDASRLDQAITHFRAACAADPDFAEARGELLQALLQACDWDRAEAQVGILRELAQRAPPDWMGKISPMTAFYLRLDPLVCKAVAEYHARQYEWDIAGPVQPRAPHRQRPQRLKIGYFSADMRDHAVGRLVNGAFGHHDRARFETWMFAFGPPNSSSYRATISGSVEHFVDIAAQSDEQAARTIADAGIDVLIDLMGHTMHTRLGVLARRPAPVQVHYLGYPATTGASYVNYYVTDPVVTPQPPENHFTETLAYVPDCYQVSDGAEAFDLAPAARSDHGLPPDAFVYANFTSSSRLDRDTFRLWMRILEGVPGSVLWVLAVTPIVEANLRREAAALGMDPDRLIFGPRESNRPAHLSRLGCADLALDTLYWSNGHSTAADLLWAGVPIVTVLGSTFATRVGASLLTAAGVPEMVVSTREAYVATAIALGHDRERAAALKAKLRAARTSAPYFQTARLVRGLEDAYDAMYAGTVPR